MSPLVSAARWERLRPARSALAVSVALLIATASWIGVRASLPTDGAPVLTDGGYAKGLTVDASESDPTPLRSGDVVVAIEGVPVDDLLRGDTSPMPAFEAGTTWRYDVLRGADRETIEVRLREGGFIRERLREGASIFLIGLIVAALGAWATIRRPDQPAARSLLVLGAGLTAYNVFQAFCADVAVLPSARGLFAVAVAGHVGALAIWTTAAAHLAVSLPEPLPLLRTRPWVAPVAYVTTFVLAAGLQGGAIAAGATGLSTLDAFYNLMQIVLWLMTAVTIGGLVRTIRRSLRTPDARRQGILVALGMCTTIVALIIASLITGDGPLPVWYAAVAFVPIPAALSVAIVRGEFLDLRATVSRALVFATVTVVLLGAYALVVAGLGAIIGSTGLAATIPATAIVAIAIAPVRTTLQRSVDRVLYGDRGDPARVLAELGRRLSVAPPAEDVLGVIAETVSRSLRLPYVAIRISTNGHERLACERGERTEEVETMPLVHRGQPVGELAVAPRSGQRALTRHDRTLITNIAQQTASAVAAASLLTELSARRRDLVVAREQERAQLRHDLHDRLGSQLTGLTLLLDTIESHAAERDVIVAARRGQAEAQRALDEVRRISRGLRPGELDELGLIPAIAAAARRLTDGADGTWAATVDAAVQLPAIAPAVASVAYHIASEGLTNARRHSNGTGARVRIGVTAEGSELLVEITDNGHGMPDGAPPGVGLSSMRTRVEAVGGRLAIATSASGTAIRAELPLNHSTQSPPTMS